MASALIRRSAGVLFSLVSMPALAQLQPPPPGCDHAFRGRLSVQMGAETICRLRTGCARRSGNTCSIYLSHAGIAAYGRDALIRHELGHCNCPTWRHAY